MIHFASIWKMTEYSLVFPITFLTSLTALDIKFLYSRTYEIKKIKVFLQFFKI